MIILKQYKIGVVFSGFEMNDNDNENCPVSPQKLLKEFKDVSEKYNVELTGEPTLLKTVKEVNLNILTNQLNNLSAYIPFRVSMRSQDKTPKFDEFDEFVDTIRDLVPKHYYQHRDTKRVLVIIQINHCEYCDLESLYKYFML